ncbi:DUF1922 domain-containing protein [Candidatus Bathyarchaeota archaeon]|nr:MAG: DUF1922 domain-containing protein [Candidatus Bathyarchaeota archaeon]
MGLKSSAIGKEAYGIVSCPYCKSLLIADTGYRSKSCFHCGKRFQLNDRPVLGSGRNAREARELLSKMKAQADQR